MPLVGLLLGRFIPGAAEQELLFPTAATPPAQDAPWWHRAPSRYQPGHWGLCVPSSATSRLPSSTSFHLIINSFRYQEAKRGSLLPSVPHSCLTHLAGPSGPCAGKAD